MGSAAAAADDDDNTTMTTPGSKNSTKDMGVADLYQYALASPRYRSAKDARRLRRYLLSRPAERGTGRWFWVFGA